MHEPIASAIDMLTMDVVLECENWSWERPGIEEEQEQVMDKERERERWKRNI